MRRLETLSADQKRGKQVYSQSAPTGTRLRQPAKHVFLLPFNRGGERPTPVPRPPGDTPKQGETSTPALPSLNGYAGSRTYENVPPESPYSGRHLPQRVGALIRTLEYYALGPAERGPTCETQVATHGPIGMGGGGYTSSPLRTGRGRPGRGTAQLGPAPQPPNAGNTPRDLLLPRGG